MKVLLVNGSPRRNGATNEVMTVAAAALNECGIETEIYQIGAKPIGGCMACYQCKEKGKCVIDDCVNEFVQKAKEADGFIFGSPVYYAALAGNLTSFLDRVFYSAAMSGNGDAFRFKPAAGLLTARRGGMTTSYDQFNKYFGISQMPIISTRYWNMIHSSGTAESIYQDEEGVQSAQMLAKNMAYYLKCIELGKEHGILPPEQEPTTMTNFIR